MEVCAPGNGLLVVNNTTSVNILNRNFYPTIPVSFCYQKLHQLPPDISFDVPGVKKGCTMSTRFLCARKEEINR